VHIAARLELRLKSTSHRRYDTRQENEGGVNWA